MRPAATVAGILDAFIPFVLFLGLIIPPIAAIYVIDGFTRFHGVDPAESIRALPTVRWTPLLVWIGSALLASAATWTGWSVTRVPALDATLAAAIAYSLALGVGTRRRLPDSSRAYP